MTDGSYRWSRLSGLRSYDERDKVTRAIGTFLDVNEETEKAFMLKKLVNALPGGVGIFKCTPHLHCLYFNKGPMDLGSRLPQQIPHVFDSSADLEN